MLIQLKLLLSSLKRQRTSIPTLWHFSVFCFVFLVAAFNVHGFDFSTSKLQGANLTMPTSLQFGPDDRLYIGQYDGLIKSYAIERTSPNTYQASDEEIITLIASIPNYDDDGTQNPNVNGRQLTGILVTGTSTNPIIYVSSSDPRVGAGSGGENDSNLDTNSSIISRLTKTGLAWNKVDIVRGLPRSEENHSTNGLQIDPFTNMLYVAQGGNTNAGGPSVNFAFACETALSASILTVDLNVIEAMTEKTDIFGQTYLYNLPTLNDPNPSRLHNPDGSNVNDPFGGNDGLNQAKIVLGGPVQVYASGFRNPYDLLITQSPGQENRLYSFDNAANEGWGGYPKNEGATGNTTNEYQPTEPGAVNNEDNLHYIDTQGYYAGHPNPIRANPASAGWFHYDNELADDGDPETDPMIYSTNPTTDWPPLPISMANPIEGDFQMPGISDGALMTNSASTNGMAEYLGTNFDGGMTGDIIVASFDGNLLRVELSEDGHSVANGFEYLATEIGSTPLDVTTPFGNLGGEFTGTIWVAHLLAENSITILEPADFDAPSTYVCTGINSFDIDEDNDGYSNADEILNNSDPCSGALLPADVDGDFISDLLDTDDDNDGIDDEYDLFPLDSNNGASTSSAYVNNLFNDSSSTFFDVGMTGLMKNSGDEYLDGYDPTNFIAGGTAGLFTIVSVEPGTAIGNANDQRDAFHFGITSNRYMPPYVIRVGISGPFFNSTPQGGQSQGFYIGTGDQDNFIKIAINANQGTGGIEIVHEEAGNTLLNTIIPNASVITSNYINLYLEVDPLAGTVKAKYNLDGDPTIFDVGNEMIVGGDLILAVMDQPSLAVGLIATTGNALTPSFTATWDDFEILPQSSTAAAYFKIDPPQNTLAEASTYSDDSFYVENLSTNGQLIEKVVVDLSTALYPDAVFDINGQAGDPVAKGFTADATSGVGTVTHTYLDPNNGTDANDGYNGLEVNFTAFEPTDYFSFSIDIDPNSVKGAAAPGENHSASVSGLELAGTTVTVFFSDGSEQKTTLSHISANIDASDGFLTSEKPLQPTIQHLNATSPVTSTDPQTIRVAGPAGSTVSLYHTDGALYTEGAVGGGYNIEPLEANTVVYFVDFETLIGVKGYVDISVPLSKYDEKSGINRLQAVLIDSEGVKGPASAPLVIEYDPIIIDTSTVVRVNAGGGNYIDDLGQLWSADYGYNTGGTAQEFNAISGTENDSIYQSERYDESAAPELNYTFNLSNNEYLVKLHFAEIYAGAMSVGARVFGIKVQDVLIAQNIDIYKDVGANAAYVLSIPATVSDGSLTIEFIHGAEDPKISGIEIIETGPADLEAPTVPTALIADSISYNATTLSWAASTDNVGPVTYEIYRNLILVGTSEIASFTDSSLLPETTYAYEVIAVDPSSNASTAASLSVITLPLPADNSPPSAPGTLSVDSVTTASAMISWTASTDEFGIASYTIHRDGSLLTTLPGTVTSYLDTTLTLSTSYLYEVFAVDLAGNVSTNANVTATTASQPDLLVNTGGAAYTDSLGRPWLADTGFNTGGTFQGSNQISGTIDDFIYQSERYDETASPELTYSFDLPNSEYLVKLHFAEIYAGAMSVGARVFSVNVQGTSVVENLDIYQEVGANAPYVLSVPTTVRNGKLNIDFVHGTEDPKISGIEVIETGPADLEAPTIPSGLVANPVTYNSASLSWTESTDNVGPVTYSIYRDLALVGTSETPSFVDLSLLPENTYAYEVYASDASANISTAASLSVLTLPLPLDTTPPSAPTNLTVDSVTTASANLSWTASSDEFGIASYQIHRDGVLLTSLTGTLTSYKDTTLALSTSYLYEVLAVDLAGNVSPKANVTATTASQPDLLINTGGGSYTDTLGRPWLADTGFNTGNAFQGSNAISGTEDDFIYQSERYDESGSPELKYTFDLPNSEYLVKLHFAEIYIGTMFEGARVFGIKVQNSLVAENVDIHKEAGANAPYILSIPATVLDGTLSIEFIHGTEDPKISGIEVIATGPADLEAPTTPTGLALDSVSYNTATLSWTASTDNASAVTYVVYRDLAFIGASETTTFTDSSLLPETIYAYEVYASDISANVSEAAMLSVITTALPTDSAPPSAPGSFAVDATSISSTTLSWTPSTDDTGIASYQIYRDGVIIATVPNSITNYEDTGLSTSTEYAYEIDAIDLAGNSSAKSTVSATTASQADILVNTGGPEYTDSLGRVWSADTGFNTGNTFQISSPISGTDDDAIYQSERYDENGSPNLKYAFTLANGDYLVNLHLAEIYTGTMFEGARVISVEIEGVLAAENVDTFKEVGANAAYVLSLPVTVSDGILDIEFIQSVENPKISGIEVIAQTTITASTETEAEFSASPILTLSTGPEPVVVENRLVNLSTRAQTGSDENVIIAGFVIDGTLPKTLLLRGIGPSLEKFDLTDALQKPVLTLVQDNEVIQTNSGWSELDNQSEVEEVAKRLGAFEIDPNSQDTVMMVTLEPGSYSAILNAADNSNGKAMIEVYEIDKNATRLVNLSTRANIGIGANIAIPGVVIDGDKAGRLLIRAVGPSLEQFEVNKVLENPILQVVDSAGNVIATNLYWSDNLDLKSLEVTTLHVGAFPLQPGSNDAALLVDLEPGAYTILVSGEGETTGIALVEIYEVAP